MLVPGRCYHPVNSGSDLTAFLVVGTVAIENVKVTGSNAGAGNTDGLVTSATVNVFSGGPLDINVDGVALDALSGATIRILNGRLDGDNADIRVAGGATVTLHNAVLVNRTISGLGTVQGEYTDAVGVTRYIADTSPAEGDITIWNTGTSRWEPTGPAGDLTGSYASPQVAGLFGSSLLGDTPAEGDMLMFSGSAWRPLPEPTTADAWAFRVKNTSGAIAGAGDVGYIDAAGEYKTTTTAQADVIWCVATTSGANNADIYVARRGRVAVNYIGSAPGAGDFLVTSTTAGSAQAQATMRPEIFAVCVAAGAGGTVEALLLCHTIFRPLSNSENLCSTGTGAEKTGDSTWAGTIATLPGGAVLTYSTTSGDENVLHPHSSGQLAKMRLYNSTRSDYALISDVTLGTNTITLTASVPGGWATTDVITVDSQTNTGTLGGASFIDFEVTSSAIDDLARALMADMSYRDTGATGGRCRLHPWESDVNSKRQGVTILVTSIIHNKYCVFPLISSRYCAAWEGSGAATVQATFQIRGEYVAAP
jgi:hypothetical protein